MKALETKRSLVDPQKREITYLRVSLTQRCNMKCSYCFGSIENHNNASELSDYEIVRLIESFAVLGVNKIRLTGGEPLLRPAIIDLIAAAKAIEGITHIGLTTNGLLLEPLLPKLISSGLDSINISLDSLRPEIFSAITKTDGLNRVMAGINAAIMTDAFPVKINTVVMRGFNDNELPDLAYWALEQKIDLRFIEFMPTGKSGWNQGIFIGEKEMQQRIGMELERCDQTLSSPGPAVTYRHKDFPGRISFISAVTGSFCARCNRLRLTSRGEVFGCLFQDRRIDLKELLRSGAGTDEIANHVVESIGTPGFRRSPGEVSISDFRPLMQAVGG